MNTRKPEIATSKSDMYYLKTFFKLGQIIIIFPNKWKIIVITQVILTVLLLILWGYITTTKSSTEILSILNYIQHLVSNLTCLYGLLRNGSHCEELFKNLNASKTSKVFNSYRIWRYLMTLLAVIGMLLKHAFSVYIKHSIINVAERIYFSVLHVQLIITVLCTSEIVAIIELRHNSLAKKIKSMITQQRIKKELLIEDFEVFKENYRDTFYGWKLMNRIFGIWMWNLLSSTFIAYLNDIDFYLSLVFNSESKEAVAEDIAQTLLRTFVLTVSFLMFVYI